MDILKISETLNSIFVIIFLLLAGSLLLMAVVLSVSCFSRDLFVDHAADSKPYIQDSYMEDTFAQYNGSGDGDDDNNQTTEGPMTTTTIPTTTTTVLTTTRPDHEVPDLSKFCMGFDVIFDKGLIL